MVTELQELSGEQLLIAAVLGGPKVRPAVDVELDRRALLGRPRPERRWRPGTRILASARYGGPVAA